MIAFSQERRRLKLIFLLWSLLFTKCFALEYLGREYEIPINSFYYVWCLSLSMATIATIVFGRVEKTPIRNILLDPIAQLQVAAIIPIAACIAWGQFSPNLANNAPLTTAAILMGIRHRLKPKEYLRLMDSVTMLIWALAGIGIYFASPPFGYLLFCLLYTSDAADD